MLLLKVSSLSIFIVSTVVSAYEATISPNYNQEGPSEYLATDGTVGGPIFAQPDKYYWNINELDGKVTIQSATTSVYASFIDNKIITSNENGVNQEFIFHSSNSGDQNLFVIDILNSATTWKFNLNTKTVEASPKNEGEANDVDSTFKIVRSIEKEGDPCSQWQSEMGAKKKEKEAAVDAYNKDSSPENLRRVQQRSNELAALASKKPAGC
ncbi:unnamed protein product [Cunninghamella echinulata]